MQVCRSGAAESSWVNDDSFFKFGFSEQMKKQIKYLNPDIHWLLFQIWINIETFNLSEKNDKGMVNSS